MNTSSSNATSVRNQSGEYIRCERVRRLHELTLVISSTKGPSTRTATCSLAKGITRVNLKLHSKRRYFKAQLELTILSDQSAVLDTRKVKIKERTEKTGRRDILIRKFK